MLPILLCDSSQRGNTGQGKKRRRAIHADPEAQPTDSIDRTAGEGSKASGAGCLYTWANCSVQAPWPACGDAETRRRREGQASK